MDNLYPPIFYQSFMPAFTTGCKIYFGLSAFNARNEIGNVLITIQNQKTNKNAFNISDAPIGIYNAGPVLEDTSKQTEDRFYIDLPPAATLDINTYYKVQLRFVKKGIKTSTIDNDFLQENMINLSEWSTVVLLRRIDSPVIELLDFPASEVKNFTIKDIVVKGSISFLGEEKERIKSYKIKLYEEDKLLEDSGDIQVDPFKKVAEVFYRFKYDFQTNIEYSFTLSYVTQELFSNQQSYKFKIDEVLSQDIFLTGIEISSIKDEQSGRIGVHIYKPESQIRQNNFIIKRTDSKSNFKIWEQVYYYSVPLLEIIDFTWFDKTIESGVYYLYGIEKLMEDGKTRSQLLKLQNPIRLDFHNILLSTKDQQLKIKYNAEISNITYNIQENQVNTIGSKYPIITRNSNIKYRTLSLSGLITYFMDIRENTMGLSRKELYGEQENLYKEDNQLRNITPYDDFIYERDFRQKVIDFLEKNNIKMLRTIQEGNLLVKLMNISVTPMPELEGYLYSFNCTAVEIDDFNFENLKKYNLTDYGSFIKYPNPIKDFLISINAPNQSAFTYNSKGKKEGVVNSLQSFSPVNTNFIENNWTKTYLRDLYTENEIGEEIRNNLKIKYLNYLRIEFSNPPYPIYKEGNALVGNRGTEEEINKENIAIGHIVKINNVDTLVGKNGIFELSGKGVQITDFKFLMPGQTGTLIMQGIVEIIPKKINIPISYHSFKRVGQLWDNFAPRDSIVMKIYDKYTQTFAKSEKEEFTKNTVSTKLQRIDGMRFYGKPGTIIYVKELQDDALEKHVIGEGEILEFFEQNTAIQEAYFSGMHFQKAPQGTEVPYPYQYIDTGISKNSLNDLKNINDPIINGIYSIQNGDKYIYYNNAWYQISENYDINLLSIQGIVEYFCTILQEEYNNED